MARDGRDRRDADRQPKAGRPLPFQCALCGFSACAQYYGRRPPFNPHIAFLEDCYIIRDPLASDASRPVCLGSECAECRRVVCAGPRCSVFYRRRLCAACTQETAVRQTLPAEMLGQLPPAPASATDEQHVQQHAVRPGGGGGGGAG